MITIIMKQSLNSEHILSNRIFFIFKSNHFPDMDNLAVFWFRRDLRVEDNRALYHALTSGYKVLPVFIYDTVTLDKLERDDRKMSVLKDCLLKLREKLLNAGSNLITLHGNPVDVLKKLLETYNIKAIYYNRDYEPYALKRDKEVTDFFTVKGIPCFSFKDRLIFEPDEVLKDDGSPYTMFTPYKNRWLKKLNSDCIKEYRSQDHLMNCYRTDLSVFLSPEEFGFICPPTTIKAPLLNREQIRLYNRNRDYPAIEGTTMLGIHLRFGTLSIREVMRRTIGINPVFTSELIWREFFMQILYHFPYVTKKSFRPEYDRLEWLNNEEYFRRWCEGRTGVPLIDACMRELSVTGYMHNRVRMVAANYLTKILLIDWRWGEAWFALKLLDYELSSNNGNWQWAAGTGCDAVPWFRIFNPDIQAKKFDPESLYIRRWIPEYGTPDYPLPIVVFSEAREHALKYFRNNIGK